MNATQKRRILVTGTIAFDHLFSYDSQFLEQLREATTMEVLSVSFQPYRYVKRHGGTGVNIAWNIALLGGSPLLVGNVGSDGKDYVTMLKERGIDTTYVDEKTSSMTPTGVCCTDTREHQIWFFYRGADGVGHWPELGDKAKESQYAIIGARNPSQMLEGLQWCKAAGIPRLFDPGQYIMDFTVDDLRTATALSTGVIVNEFEWGMLQKRLGCTPEDIVKTAEYLIITKSEQGYTIHTQTSSEDFPRCDCDKLVNPTGAGDSFRAGMILGLTSGWTLQQASQLGAAIASFVVEQEGTLLDSLDMQRLQARVSAAYGEALPKLPM